MNYLIFYDFFLQNITSDYNGEGGGSERPQKVLNDIYAQPLTDRVYPWAACIHLWITAHYVPTYVYIECNNPLISLVIIRHDLITVNKLLKYAGRTA